MEMKNKGASLTKGLSEQYKVEQKNPRGETAKGQAPVCKKKPVSSDRGKFQMS